MNEQVKQAIFRCHTNKAQNLIVKIPRLDSLNEVFYFTLALQYQGSDLGKNGDMITGEQSINMDQAKVVEADGGNSQGTSVLHEVLESYAGIT